MAQTLTTYDIFHIRAINVQISLNSHYAAVFDAGV